MTAPQERFQLVARTRQGDWRVGCRSEWKYAQSRFSAATDNRSAAITVRAFVDGKWQKFDGFLCVRSCNDPAYQDLPVANNGQTGAATVRAADFRKVR